ncbi:polyphosphate:nucleotide phosphotransferase, PPK2 family [Pedobacter westerhofensis]|uniref:Polyphosphate:nucleotide phosphotransferase, PPK2 family n=1 Tax=Pedobacter westerhofensis TaxID=425512 RepID=A0A521FAZ5_9SPHI|nr:polyphosphate kinase 2 family protein [Pedobacter westerhofensis]SMO93319.1 polyphosphate:nucleotide phosphotransferase, PPK2 family [Pedobacter westerhofensis]
MSKDQNRFLAPSGQKIKLKDYSTNYTGDIEKEVGKATLEVIKEKLSKYQETLYAENSHSVLIIFQAMDAAGKDSAISHVMSGLNPQGCQVFSFKTPTSNEYEHDFLWRHYLALPQRGRISIHNRSHYENVLVCKVHPEYVLSERIPGYDTVKKIDKSFWKARYESIRNFEKHLAENGTVILKFFLNVSEETQKERFLDRINDPSKNWKFSSADITERGLWKDYMSAYEEAIAETSTDQAPWYIIPADKKWFARLAISQILEEKFNNLNLKVPELPEDEMAKLEDYKQKLLAEV